MNFGQLVQMAWGIVLSADHEPASTSQAIGDIVHMTAVAKMEDKKAHNVDYVVKPNLEARLRRLQGLPDIPESTRSPNASVGL